MTWARPPRGPVARRRRGLVVWLTGLPASGKTTLGRRLVARLRAAGGTALLLDSDELREALGRPAGRGEAERDAFYLTLARLAALLAGQGFTAVVAATASLRRRRARARALAPRFLEVHVATPAAECARRDPKGLWRAAARGRLPGLPGAGATYQPPLHPDVTAAGGRDRKALDRIVERAAPRPDPATRPSAPGCAAGRSGPARGRSGPGWRRRSPGSAPPRRAGRRAARTSPAR